VDQNTLKTKLQEGRVVVGVISPLGHPALVEVAARAGYDYWLLDGEHGALPVADCEAAFLAAKARGIAPLVRVPRNDRSLIGQYLDFGAVGVVVPHVSTAEDARRAVSGALYPPAGQRGAGPCRANDYGLGIGMAEYTAAANRDVMVLVQAEDPDAVCNIAEICAVPGVDGIVIGPRDLSISMGYAGQIDHPEVQAAIDKIIRVAGAAGLPCALPAANPAEIRQATDRGIRILFGSVLSLLHNAMVNHLRK
jgi:2-keto-3-deoxy-L-rhamnonate aldolase RhmA